MLWWQDYITIVLIGFVDKYNTYWNQERDDMLEKKVKQGDFTHGLYTNYMNKPTRGDNPNTGVNEELPGLVTRRKSEWTLFQTGYYDKLDKWHSDASLVDAAYEVADHFMNNGLEVHYAGDDVEEAENNGRHCVYNDIQGSWDMPVQDPEHYGIVCATYVALSLWRSGLVDESVINNCGYNGCSGLKNMLVSEGWQKITNSSELQEGDVVFQPGHVLIYVGDGKCIDQAYCAKRSNGDDDRGNLTGVEPFLEAYRFVGN